MATLTPMMPMNVWPGQTYWHPDGYYTYWPSVPGNITMATSPFVINPALSAHTPAMSVHTPLPSHPPSVQFVPCTPYAPQQCLGQHRPCTPQALQPPTPCPIHVCLQPNGSELGFPILTWNLMHSPVSAVASGNQSVASLLKDFAIPTNGGDIELEVVIKDAGVSRFAGAWGPVQVRRKKGGIKGPFTVEDILLSITDYLHIPLTWERGELLTPEKVVLMQKRGLWLADPNHFWPNDSTSWSFPRRIDLLHARGFGGLIVRKPTERGWQLVMSTV